MRHRSKKAVEESLETMKHSSLSSSSRPKSFAYKLLSFCGDCKLIVFGIIVIIIIILVTIDKSIPGNGTQIRTRHEEMAVLNRINSGNSSSRNNSTSSNHTNMNVSVVLMNYGRPHLFKTGNNLIESLISYDRINQILILHANPETRFSVHDLYSFSSEYSANSSGPSKLQDIDATEANNSIGLAMRFEYCSKLASNEWVLVMDDDIIVSHETLDLLFDEFRTDTHRIVGRWGRNTSSSYAWLNPYSYYLHGDYSRADVTGVADVVLTKFMVIEKEMCNQFVKNMPLMSEVVKDGHPLWNGEDIFMSLVANKYYGTSNNMAMSWLDVGEAPPSTADISGGMSGVHPLNPSWWKSVSNMRAHYRYRGKFWKVAQEALDQPLTP